MFLSPTHHRHSQSFPPTCSAVITKGGRCDLIRPGYLKAQLTRLGVFIFAYEKSRTIVITNKTSDQNAIYALFERHHEGINTTTRRAI